MGKISTESKQKYFDKIKEYKQTIEKIQKREQNLLQIIKTADNGAEFKKLLLADENLGMISYYLLMNQLSLELLGIKNEAFLNDARKGCYKTIIYLEEIVTSYIDVPFSEYEGQLEKIEDYSKTERWELIRKLGFTLQSVFDGFGANSKWRWSFVELEARFATVVKNLLNLKTLVSDLDTSAPEYEVTVDHFELVKKLLQQAADRYREKYEVSTSRIDDFKLAISYLSALRRLHNIIGEAEESDAIKKKIEIWKSKMETDFKKK